MCMHTHVHVLTHTQVCNIPPTQACEHTLTEWVFPECSMMDERDKGIVGADVGAWHCLALREG